MNKRWKLIIFLSICLAMFTYLAITEETGTVLHSSTGCCTIYVEEVDVTDKNVIVYHVRYTEKDGTHEDSYVEQPELDSEVNMYQEWCYTHH